MQPGLSMREVSVAWAESSFVLLAVSECAHSCTYASANATKRRFNPGLGWYRPMNTLARHFHTLNEEWNILHPGERATIIYHVVYPVWSRETCRISGMHRFSLMLTSFDWALTVKLKCGFAPHIDLIWLGLIDVHLSYACTMMWQLGNGQVTS